MVCCAKDIIPNLFLWRGLMDGKDKIRLLEIYLSELNTIRLSGTRETSNYTPLINLLNGIGKTLKPKVHCVGNPKSQGKGSGIPDVGLYTKERMPKGTVEDDFLNTPPDRGVIEVKGTDEDVEKIAKSDQVKKYLNRNRRVLVTNFWDFLLVGREDKGELKFLERHKLAEKESEFWNKVSNPRKTANEHAERFIEYLTRVFLHTTTLVDPEDLARFLASYARDAKARIEEQKELPELTGIRQALEESLGMKFEGEEGEKFFRATLVQTLFYGIFSSWVLWAKETKRDSKDKFNWYEAGRYLHVPMIAGLFHQIVDYKQLKHIGLEDVLEWTGDVLNRIDRAAFFERFEQEHAVQYFYEPFLKAYDPALRKELGVWYTPPEIVKYQVARVDTVLRNELDIPDGLADSHVYVLDPCCGTGAYLVEVINTIYETLKKIHGEFLAPKILKKEVINRIFGFEILPAPFVVSHLQIGLLLNSLGAPLSDEKNERAGVYLTNALTGWEPPLEESKAQLMLAFPELKEEKEAAEKVKRNTPILVILGNPPYNAFAGTSPEEEGGLIEPYKEGLRSEWGILAGSMHDLYIRFFRIAERRITKRGKGIVCFISNFSYLGEPSFVVMRQNFLKEFDKLWFDCMNGDSRETGKLTPEGKPDPSVFSTDHNKEGIRVGTAISLMVRKEKRDKAQTIRFRHFWGITKRADVLKSLKKENFNDGYKTAKPEKSNKYSFKPLATTSEFNSWPRLVDLSSMASFPGMDEDRNFALLSIAKHEIDKRMKAYYDKKIEFDDLIKIHKGLVTDSRTFKARKVRNTLLNESVFNEARILPYVFRPFDVRWCYFEPLANLWHRPSPERARQLGNENIFLISRPAAKAQPEGVCLYITSGLSARDMLKGHGNCIPILLKQEYDSDKDKQISLSQNDEKGSTKWRANLSSETIIYYKKVGIDRPNKIDNAFLIWLHALAIGYSPAYLTENADGIRQDWPRIPLPNSKEALMESAELGRQVADLLDTEKDFPGDSLPEMAFLETVDKDKQADLDLNLTAGWGHGGKDGVCMPGKGRVESRPYTEAECAAIKQVAESHGLTHDKALEQLGRVTCDIYLNERAFWRNVPSGVWEYYIGGYQVVKKWLSYRERGILGRPLKPDEVIYFTKMARRIAAILLLQPELDANYKRVKESTYSWPVE